MGIQDNDNFCSLIVNDMCTQNGKLDTACQSATYVKCVDWKKNQNFIELNNSLREKLKQIVTSSIASHDYEMEGTIPVQKEILEVVTSETLEESATRQEAPKKQHVLKTLTHAKRDEPVQPQQKLALSDVDVAVGDHQGTSFEIPNIRHKVLPSIIQRPEQPFPNTRVQGVPVYDSTLTLPDIEIEKLCMDYLNRK